MKQRFIFLAFIMLTSVNSHFAMGKGQGDEMADTHKSEVSSQVESKEFKPGEFILDYLGDAHEWKLFSVGEKHFAVPLPIILYSRTRNKPFVFWSSKFNHGYTAYNGFKLVTKGDLKGKIAEVDEQDQVIQEAPLPLDFSITKNVTGIFFSIILMSLIFIPVGKKYIARQNQAPTGLQNLLETLILFVRDEIAIPSIGEKNYLKFMPFLLSLFFFIWINNVLGLIPIFPAGANVTGNIAVTMALALVTLFMIIINGNKHFWKEIFNAPGVPVFLKLPIPIMPIVEIAGWLIKPAVLMIRLFANMLAGHLIAKVLFALIFIFGAQSIYFGYGISVISVFLAVFMSALKLLVSVIQAYVFTILAAIFLGIATSEHH